MNGDDEFVPDEEEEEDEDSEDEEIEPDDGVLEGGVAEPAEAGKSRRTASQADIVRTNHSECQGYKCYRSFGGFFLLSIDVRTIAIFLLAGSIHIHCIRTIWSSLH